MGFGRTHCHIPSLHGFCHRRLARLRGKKFDSRKRQGRVDQSRYELAVRATGIDYAHLRKVLQAVRFEDGIDKIPATCHRAKNQPNTTFDNTSDWQHAGQLPQSWKGKPNTGPVVDEDLGGWMLLDNGHPVAQRGHPEFIAGDTSMILLLLGQYSRAGSGLLSFWPACLRKHKAHRTTGCFPV